MAKKKNNKQQQQGPVSPEKFLRTRARSLTIGKCYITPNWQEAGIANVIVTRENAQGKITAGFFLVDTYCLGVKDAAWTVNEYPAEFEDVLDGYRGRSGLDEISYDEAHNLIYGAIGFAEDAGIKPHKDFALASYVLEEDTDDVPLIEYEFGYKGKHHLVIGKHRKEAVYLDVLRKNLGEDNFTYVDAIPFGMFDGDDYEDCDDEDFDDEDVDDEDFDDEDFYDEDFDEDEDPRENWAAKMLAKMCEGKTEEEKIAFLESLKHMCEASERYPSEPYTYVNPDYPVVDQIKHRDIIDAVVAPKDEKLSREVLEAAMQKPADELADDLSAIIYDVLAQRHSLVKPDADGYIPSYAIMNACILLTGLKSDRALDAVKAIVCQNEDFQEYNFGDFPEPLAAALYTCGRNNLAALEELLYLPGIESRMRALVAEVLVAVMIHEPERRAEVLAMLSLLLDSLPERLPDTDACDALFTGLLTCDLMDAHAVELLPQLKAVFETGCVDTAMSGTWDDVEQELKNPTKPMETIVITDVYELWDSI